MDFYLYFESDWFLMCCLDVLGCGYGSSDLYDGIVFGNVFDFNKIFFILCKVNILV